MSNGFSGVGLNFSPLIGGRSGSDVLYHAAGGTVTLGEDLYCNSLSVNTGTTLVTAGYRIYARNFVRVYGSGVIRNNGTVGAVGTGSALGGAGGARTTTGGGAGGGNGGEDGGFAPSTSFTMSLGGTGGAGAAGDGGGGGGGGVASWVASLGAILQPTIADLAAVFSRDTLMVDPLKFFYVVGGAGGGGGGGTGAGGGVGLGGGGGGGGGVVHITANEIILDDTGQIQALGGAGGAGDATGGDSGGGGGGGGGVIIVKTNFVRIANGAQFNVTGGAGGAGGGAGPTGNAGANGSVVIFSPHGCERLTGAATFAGATYPILPRR